SQEQPSAASQPAASREQLHRDQTYAGVASSPAPTVPVATKRPPVARGGKVERPARILARLPANHLARKASPIATLQKLRAELAEPLAAAIKGVQHIPTGIAITAHSAQGMEALLEKKDEISAVLTNAQMEKEERWAICIVPGMQPEYRDYCGGTQTLAAEEAAGEFARLTGATPHQSHWARAQPGRPSNALVLAFSPEAAAKLPKVVEIYGRRRPVIIKPPKAQIMQCSRCWGFHPERYCNRSPRCRRCSSKDHQEEHPACHKKENEACGCPDRCTNCLGPHAANDPSCPARPVVRNGVLQKNSRSRQRDIRNAQNQAYWAKSADCFCGGRFTTPEEGPWAPPAHAPVTTPGTPPVPVAGLALSKTPSTAPSAASLYMRLDEEEL
ncbi:hypothetical protein ACJ73_10324, partial [Blastomyces percursus]